MHYGPSLLSIQRQADKTGGNHEAHDKTKVRLHVCDTLTAPAAHRLQSSRAVESRVLVLAQGLGWDLMQEVE